MRDVALAVVMGCSTASPPAPIAAAADVPMSDPAEYSIDRISREAESSI